MGGLVLPPGVPQEVHPKARQGEGGLDDVDHIPVSYLRRVFGPAREGTRHGQTGRARQHGTEGLSNNVVGMAAMLVAMALMPLSDALAKHLVTAFSAEQVSLFRNAAHAAILLPITIAFHGWRAIRAELKLDQVLRAACFVLMTVCYVAGLRWTPLAEAMATVFLFPCLVLIGSVVFFHEKVGLGRWGAAVIGLAGVTIVAGASFAEAGLGLLWVLAAALFTAAYMLMTKAVSQRAPTLVLGLMPALIGALLLLPPGLAAWRTPSLFAAALMALVGLIAAAAHLLIVLAYSKADASLVAPLAYTQIIMATLYGFLLFGDAPALSTWIGIGIIMASGVFMAARERKASTGATGRR